MSKDITEGILLRAGFEGSNENFTLKIAGGFIIMTHWKPICDDHRREWDCVVSINNNKNGGEIDIQTVSQFNQLMELMDIDFRLTEE